MSQGQPDLLKAYPREILQVIIFAGLFIWESPVAVTGLVLYWIMVKLLKVQGWMVLAGGGIIAGITILLEWFSQHLAPKQFIAQGLIINRYFWKQTFFNDYVTSFHFIFDHQLIYILGFGLFAAGLLTLADLIPHSPHKARIDAMKKGLIDGSRTLSSDVTNKLLMKLDDQHETGTVIGVSQINGRALVIPDKDINQIALVLGTTGGGKTITLRRFYKRAISQNYPLIIVDGKPSPENVEWVRNLAEKNNRLFHGFNCGNYYHYDPLAHGGFTELKDKIICLKDLWQSEYYRSIAEDYLQTTFELIIKTGNPYTLKTVADCLNYNTLASMARNITDDEIKKRVSRLKDYDSEDITGLMAHLNILINSELGSYFQQNENIFNLADAIKNNAIVYFALPALRFPSFAKVLGKLVMNDLKAVIDRQDRSKKIFAIFDEFSVFAGEQGLNLVNMGREKGLHSIFGTQGLAELDKVDKTFRQQLMNCVNTILCHRLNDHESAEIVATWVGTQDTFNITAQINIRENDAAMGSVKQAKEYIIHPDAIKQELDIGEAYYITKVNGFRWDKVKVKY